MNLLDRKKLGPAVIALLVLLDRKINGVPWLNWGQPVALLTVASLLTGLATWGTRLGLETTIGTQGFFVNLAILVIAGGVGVGVFIGSAIALRIPEAYQLAERLRAKLLRR